MSTNAPTGPSPGMYPDPNDASRLRRWDGSDWTDEYQTRAPEVQPSATAAGTPIETESTPGVVIVGYIMSLLIPIVGFIIGIVCLFNARSSVRTHGATIVVFSVVIAIAAAAIIVNVTGGSGYESAACESWDPYC